METQNTQGYQNNGRMNMQVTIQQVDKEASRIYINNFQGLEGWYPVVQPVNMRYCNPGKANITIFNGDIVYCKNLEPKGGNSRPPAQFYGNNNPNSPSTTNKPYNTPRYNQGTQWNKFTPANKYTPKEEFYYDESEVIFERVTPEESKILAEDLKKQGKWVFYIQRLPRYGDIETVGDKTIYYLDVFIGIKTKKRGTRENPLGEVKEQTQIQGQKPVERLNSEMTEIVTRETLGEVNFNTAKYLPKEGNGIKTEDANINYL